MAELEESGDDAAVNARFDASQYAFFGKDIVEEVELGGLEDDADGDNAGLNGLGEDYKFSALGDREEGEGLGSLSDIDDLADTLLKANRIVSEPRDTRVIGGRGSFSRESFFTADRAQEADFPNWQDQQILEAERAQFDQRWWSQPHPSAHLAESRPLYKTSSYPEQQQQQHHISNEPLVRKSSLTYYQSPGGASQDFPNQLNKTSISPPTPGPQFPAANTPPFSGPQFHLSGIPHGPLYGGNITQLRPRQHNPWLDQSSAFSAENSSMLPHLVHQQLPHSNGLMPPHLLPQSQQQRLHLPQPSMPHLPSFQSQVFSPHPSPQTANQFDAMHEMVDFRDQRFRPMPRARQNQRFAQGFDGCSHRNANGWPQFRSKYMSSEEIESILRIHHAATHSNDPYVDDYYHQACLSKRSGGSRLRHHFCPNSIGDFSSRARANSEPHAYLQVDALGRIPFSSIRRPRPLVEVDPPSASVDSASDQKSSTKPLEQEPMLEARIIIEDGICFLLDVDDTDRLLQFSQPQDGGSQLRQRRQMLLEGLAESLQLVDPIAAGKSGQMVGIAPKDDFVFLRLASLPKGRKLLSRYLELLFPGSDLTRIVCMAIFRHLRFLFGELPSDPVASQTTINLSRTISASVRGMELGALSACLAAIVCSTEQPPLRPLASPAGDGASVIIKAVLERATELLTDRDAASSYSMPNRALWQASFDAFFVLLTKYCLSKYDTIMQSLLMQAPHNDATTGSEITRAISKEMPVELLRASLPHTNEQQRKVLLDFAQRSMPATGYNSHGGGPVTSETLPS